jgi:hypothetical protein
MRLDQRGQILVPAAALMGLFFGALAIFVVDTGLVEAGYQQLAETVQASAEDASNAIDVAQLRASDGRVVVLDPAAVRQMADRSLKASALAGLDSWSVQVNGATVTITARLKVRLLMLGEATLTETRAARLTYGQ